MEVNVAGGRARQLNFSPGSADPPGVPTWRLSSMRAVVAGDLERALDLRAQSDQLWAVTADANYEAANGMFGGWTAAVLLKAVVLAGDADATPVAITANFVSQLPPGSEALIETRRAGGGRSVSHWTCELRSLDGEVRATGPDVVTRVGA